MGDLKNLHVLLDAASVLFGQAPLQVSLQSESYVVEHGEMRKQGVILKQVPDIAMAGGNVDPVLGVEEHATVERDLSRIRSRQAGDGQQGESLPGSGRPEQDHKLLLGGKGRLQREAAPSGDHGLFHIHMDQHFRVSQIRVWPESAALQG